MALHGMNVSPRDLDIVINFKDMKKAEKAFEDYVTSKTKSLQPLINCLAWDILLRINDVEIQILGENEEGEYCRELKEENLDFINLNKKDIPCFKLKIDANIYERTNKLKKQS
jgi:hypothetical protein